MVLVWFQKISIPSPWKGLDFPVGVGGQRPRKILRGGGVVSIYIIFSRPVPLFLYVKFSLFAFCLPIRGRKHWSCQLHKSNIFKVVRLDFWCCESLVILPNSGWLANSSCCGRRVNPVNYTKNLCHTYRCVCHLIRTVSVSASSSADIYVAFLRCCSPAWKLSFELNSCVNLKHSNNSESTQNSSWSR